MARLGIAPPDSISDPHTKDPFMPEVEPATIPMTKEVEQIQRLAVIREARSWNGTPYRQQGDIKGPKGCIDCSMLLVRCWVDAGVFKPFDPRPYSPDWHLHVGTERYLGWLNEMGVEVEKPQAGDIVVWQFGRCFSHGGIMVNNYHAMQASQLHKVTFVEKLDSPWLLYMRDGRTLRPRKFFDIWARLREKYGTN
jgi:cell wall-associated NlpC family hydrolase